MLISILSENAMTQRGCGGIGLAHPVHGEPRESFPENQEGDTGVHQRKSWVLPQEGRIQQEAWLCRWAGASLEGRRWGQAGKQGHGAGAGRSPEDQPPITYGNGATNTDSPWVAKGVKNMIDR